MFKFLLLIFLFILLLVFLLGFSFLRFLGQLFGIRPPQDTRRKSSSKQSRQTSRDSERSRQTSKEASRKKIFDKDQGEYTDYEEIK